MPSNLTDFNFTPYKNRTAQRTVLFLYKESILLNVNLLAVEDVETASWVLYAATEDVIVYVALASVYNALNASLVSPLHTQSLAVVVIPFHVCLVGCKYVLRRVEESLPK